MNSIILNLCNICFSYPGGPPVLKDLDFQLRQGDRIGLVAPNGSGKTTLFHIIMGLIKPDSGTLEAFGTTRCKEKDFLEVRKRIGLLFQDADDQLFSPTVLEDVAFGPLNLGKSREEAMEIALKALDFLGLKDFENRVTYKLSGGEKRLISLATVLAMDPEALLLDEPSTGLDGRTRDILIDLLNTLSLPFVLISHDLDFISRTVNRTFSLENGRICCDQEIHIHAHPHAHPLGRQDHSHG